MTWRLLPRNTHRVLLKLPMEQGIQAAEFGADANSKVLRAGDAPSLQEAAAPNINPVLAAGKAEHGAREKDKIPSADRDLGTATETQPCLGFHQPNPERIQALPRGIFSSEQICFDAFS